MQVERLRASVIRANFVLLASAFSVCAMGQTDSATARVLFEEGRRLIHKKDYADACPKFEESYRLDPGIGTLLNLADCWEHIGRTASAWARFLEIADMTKRLGQTDRERVARARAAALEPKLSRLHIEVGSTEPGLELLRDGAPFGQAQWGMDVPVDPGNHTIEAKAPGFKSWTTVIQVPEGGKKAVVLVPSLVKAEPPLPAPVAAPLSQPPAPKLTPPPQTYPQSNLGAERAAHRAPRGHASWDYLHQPGS